MTDTAKRLRQHYAERSLPTWATISEAADEIEQMQALIASTRLPHCGCGRNPVTAQLLTKDTTSIERMQTEVLRLRAALYTIAGTPKFKPPPLDEMIEIAVTALSDKDVVQSILKRDRV